MHCKIIDLPVSDGAERHGCTSGPNALRAAGLRDVLLALGHDVEDIGSVRQSSVSILRHPNLAVRALSEVAAWTAAIAEAAYTASGSGMPIFLGGDHSIAAGTLAGLARRAAERARPLFVLWIDAHPDFHTLDTTASGNLHGVPLAYACGIPGFAGFLPPLATAVDATRTCALGVRSVDRAEDAALHRAGVTVLDMSAVDRRGVAQLLEAFLERVRRDDGLLHVSFDVDALDPAIAPGVGTPVPGGFSFREAHLVMEILHESGRVASLDLVELDPLLDERGRTASLMVDLTASLMGRRILNEATKAA